MPACSAGILLHRRRDDRLEVLLGHPGGPYWRSRDAGAWTLPKGAITPGETAVDAALREFLEETGQPVGSVPWPLGRIRQRGGKWVEAFTAEGDFDPAALRSNAFELEWPPRSGRLQQFPELDRVAWYDLAAARIAILPSQIPLLDALAAGIQARGGAPAGMAAAPR